MTIETIDKWLTSLRFNEIKKKKKKMLMLVFNRFYFLSAGRDCRLGFSISHVTFSKVTSVWEVSAVAILDCSLNVYACGRQKAVTMPAYCVAANCRIPLPPPFPEIVGGGGWGGGCGGGGGGVQARVSVCE